MNRFLVFIVFLVPLTVFANDKKAERMEKAKSRAMKNIDRRINSLQTLKSCIQSAQAKSEVMKCREQNQERMGELKKEAKEARKQYKNRKS